jgi:hypothetical protein
LRVSTTTHPKTARRGLVGPVAFASLRDAVGVVRGFVHDLEPGRVGARDAKGLIELFGEMTRLCGGGVTLLAPRVADTKVWADDGARTPAEWMSRVTGAPIGQTIGMLETAQRLAGLPATAPRASLRGLEERARAVRDAARPAETEARYRAAHAGRDLSTWVDTDGAGRLTWRGTPDALAGLKAAVSPFVKE